MCELKGILICFVGIDGSGKTTIAKEMNRWLKREGFSSIYIYGRVKPCLSRALMFLGRIFLLRSNKMDIFHDYSNHVKKKEKLLQNRIIANIFIWAFLIDQIFQINLKILPRLLLGRILICDRYIHDTVITDIAPDMLYSPEDALMLIRLAGKMIPWPDKTILVDIDEEIAIKRKNDVPDIRYLHKRRILYKALQKPLEMELIDGSKPKGDLNKYIYRIVQRVVGAI